MIFIIYALPSFSGCCTLEIELVAVLAITAAWQFLLRAPAFSCSMLPIQAEMSFAKAWPRADSFPFHFLLGRGKGKAVSVKMVLCFPGQD